MIQSSAKPRNSMGAINSPLIPRHIFSAIIKWPGLIILILLGGCADESQIRRATEVFGTPVEITIEGMDKERAVVAMDEVFFHFDDMHRRFHAWREGELAVVNRAIAKQALPLTVSAPMADMLALAVEYTAKSDGLFNPAAGRLFALWGFHADELPTVPPSVSAIADYLLSASDDIVLRGRVLTSAHPHVQLDFGALAKGAALDQAHNILRHRGVQDALINIGGNILAMGQNGNYKWRVSIRPAKKTLGVIELSDGEAIATSGGGVRYFVHQGRRYHHIIDPRTGWPGKINTAAVVLSAAPRHAGAISDAAATALMLANDEEADRITRAFGIAAMRVDEHGVVRLSETMRKRFIERDKI